MTITLVTPSLEYLDSYATALHKGWSPSDVLHPDAIRAELTIIHNDPVWFIGQLDDPEGKGQPITLHDGSEVPRLPNYRRWIWDGEFSGSMSFRWQPGTVALPPYCLGHIGYAVAPWKRNRGYATRALALLLALPEVRARGLPYVEITTDVDNTASQKVILANGGRHVERFTKIAATGGGEGMRYRIDLDGANT